MTNEADSQSSAQIRTGDRLFHTSLDGYVAFPKESKLEVRILLCMLNQQKIEWGIETE